MRKVSITLICFILLGITTQSSYADHPIAKSLLGFGLGFITNGLQDNSTWATVIASGIAGAIQIHNPNTEGRDYTPNECPVVGNTKTGFYFTDKTKYHYNSMLKINQQGDNRVCFQTEISAQENGYVEFAYNN